jgi:hypothetical protein
MQFTTLVLAALTGAATITASPTPLTTRQQSCTLIPATSTTSSNGNGLSLAKTPARLLDQAIAFAIPAGLPGPCQLEARFPAGYAVSNSGDAQVDVVATTGPAAGALVGTAYFSADPAQAKTVFVNSFACAPDMGYALTLAGAEGAVEFAGTGEAGLFMAVGDCW